MTTSIPAPAPRTRRSTRSRSNHGTIANDEGPSETPTPGPGRPRKHSKARGNEHKTEPTFEIIVLGSGGGPLETDCSGYLVKAINSRWEDGVLALEGGSGLGALASILANQSAAKLFPTLEIPPTHDTPLLQAAYVFSFLACYLITHAHLDHVGSLIMLSGSVPPRTIEHSQPPSIFPRRSSQSTIQSESEKEGGSSPSLPSHPRPHVYGTRQTLEQLSQAYMGGLWPELGSWLPDREGVQDDDSAGRKKRKTHHLHSHSHSHDHTHDHSRAEKVEDGLPKRVNGTNGTTKADDENYNSCLLFSPLSTEKIHRPLHPTLPFSLLTYPVVHGCTSKHTYESSAMFIRYDLGAISQLSSSASSSTSRSASTPISTQTPMSESGLGLNGSNGTAEAPRREFLFFGDLESAYRRPGEEGVDAERGKEAERLNGVIWEEASKSWNDGRLCGIFIECSYDSARPAHLMFGHLSPPGLYYELKRLGALISTSEPKPLEGLKIYIIHIKDALVPHPTGKTAREIIMSELLALEEEGQLGVQFVETKRGDRIGQGICWPEAKPCPDSRGISLASFPADMADEKLDAPRCDAGETRRIENVSRSEGQKVRRSEGRKLEGQKVIWGFMRL